MKRELDGWSPEMIFSGYTKTIVDGLAIYVSPNRDHAYRPVATPQRLEFELCPVPALPG